MKTENEWKVWRADLDERIGWFGIKCFTWIFLVGCAALPIGLLVLMAKLAGLF